MRWQAVQYYGHLSAPHCELEDLIQSGYEALVYTLQMYDSEKGGFLTYLGYALHRAFRDAAGYRRKRDAFLRCRSLDDPIVFDNDDDFVLADIIEDPSAAAAFNAADRRIFNEQLHAALEIALAQINEQDSDTLRCIYYDSKTLDAIAKERNVSKERIRQRSAHGLRGLRHCKQMEALRQFLDYATPSKIGGMRPTESAVIIREDIAQSKGRCL